MEQQWIDRGIERAKAGDYVEAIAAFGQAIAANPISAQAYTQRGLAYYDAGRLHDAISDYSKAIELDKQRFAAYYGRAIARLALQNPSGALADVDRALAIDENHAAAQRFRGSLCRKLNDIPNAIASFKKAAQLYLQRKDKENCQFCLDAIAQLQPKPPVQPAAQPQPIPSVGDIYSQLLDRIRGGDARGALKDLNWALQADDGDAQAYCCRGMAYSKLNQPQQALQDFNRALQLNPKDSLALRNRGRARFQLGDRSGAMADFNRALQLNPEDALVYVAQGNAFRDAGDYHQAISAYHRALELDETCTSAYLNRATAYARLEETRQAIADYQTAVSQFCEAEDWENYHQALEKLNRLQGLAPSAAVQSRQSDLGDRLRERLRSLVGGQWEIAEQLIARAKRFYPNQSEDWYIEKVVDDLERDRKNF